MRECLENNNGQICDMTDSNIRLDLRGNSRYPSSEDSTTDESNVNSNVETVDSNASNNNGPVSYDDRKSQNRGADDSQIKKDGIDYNGSGEFFVDIFDENRLPEKIYTRSEIEDVKRSFLYIISKVVDDRTFFKIGISKNNNRAATRLGELQTSLIPGLENIGFKVHYLFFYPYESKEKASSFAELIEKELHKVLRNHKKYQSMVMYFPTSNPSEWYLPSEGQYREFINFVLSFISVQTPYPEEGYRFFRQRNKNKREYMDKFLKNVSINDVIQFRKDFIKAKEAIFTRRTLTKSENLSKLGSMQYFRLKLISNVDIDNPPLGNNLSIKDIYYHKKQSDGIRIFGNYYFRIQPKSPNDIKKIFIDYSKQVGSQTQYWTHIYNILNKMKTENTLESYGMVSNYNHYFAAPLEQGKRILRKSDDRSLQLKQSQINWVIGRYMKDRNNDTTYMATDLLLSRSGNVVKHIGVKRVKDSDMTPYGDEIKCNPIIVIQLIIDYQENKLSKYEITDEYQSTEREKGTTKYKNYDIIKFKPNYFNDVSHGKEPIDKEFYAIILNDYYRYNNDVKKYIRYYDVLFESELWRLEVESVDNENNAVLVNDKKEQKDFVSKIKYKRNVISHVIHRLDAARPKRMPQEKTKKKKNKRPAVSTRRSLRNQKYNMRTRKNIRYTE